METDTVNSSSTPETIAKAVTSIVIVLAAYKLGGTLRTKYTARKARKSEETS